MSNVEAAIEVAVSSEEEGQIIDDEEDDDANSPHRSLRDEK